MHGINFIVILLVLFFVIGPAVMKAMRGATSAAVAVRQPRNDGFNASDDDDDDDEAEENPLGGLIPGFSPGAFKAVSSFLPAGAAAAIAAIAETAVAAPIANAQGGARGAAAAEAFREAMAEAKASDTPFDIGSFAAALGKTVVQTKLAEVIEKVVRQPAARKSETGRGAATGHRPGQIVHPMVPIDARPPLVPHRPLKALAVQMPQRPIAPLGA